MSRSVLQGIVERLMVTSEHLIMKRQSSVESLLAEVRDEYMLSQKEVSSSARTVALT